MFKKMVRQNTVMMSIILFLIMYGCFAHLYKPNFLYNSNGTVKEFGIGYKNKTVVPMWLFSIVLGIMSYLIVLYYLMNSRFVLN